MPGTFKKYYASAWTPYPERGAIFAEGLETLTDLERTGFASSGGGSGTEVVAGRRRKFFVAGIVGYAKAKRSVVARRKLKRRDLRSRCP